MTQTAPITNILETSAFDPIAKEDPHARLKPLREQCPVFRDEVTKTWMLSRYADVRAMVNDRTLWRNGVHAEEGSFARFLLNADKADLPPGERQSILTMDDPDHQRIRTPLAKALYARVAKARAKIDKIVSDVLDTVQAKASFDLINEVAIPIPIVTIARILGVDDTRLEEFRDWSEGLILGLNPVRSAEETAHMERSSAAMDAYFTELMAARRAQPGDDLVSDMVALQAEGAELRDVELRINLQALLVGGNLTTTDLIGNGVRQFLLNPVQKAKLVADPSLVPGAVEEILRYEGPVDVTGRVLDRDREVGGCPMHKSQSVTMSLRGANRDPEVFERPDEFDITRKGTPHVSFGGGAHICIGAPLARMEAVSFFSTFFQRFPNLRLVDEPPQWRALPFFRGLERLRVEA
ncbi:Cytochrome P450 107B1 [Alphaproteobacteria bacterium SO-S41]|nr:Cytochrome P450 107B1 [Alphaproteobacteria bacterium SO-S41]